MTERKATMTQRGAWALGLLEALGEDAMRAALVAGADGEGADGALRAGLETVPAGSRLRLRYRPESCAEAGWYEGDLTSVGRHARLGHPVLRLRLVDSYPMTAAALPDRLFEVQVVRRGPAPKKPRGAASGTPGAGSPPTASKRTYDEAMARS